MLSYDVDGIVRTFCFEGTELRDLFKKMPEPLRSFVTRFWVDNDVTIDCIAWPYADIESGENSVRVAVIDGVAELISYEVALNELVIKLQSRLPSIIEKLLADKDVSRKVTVYSSNGMKPTSIDIQDGESFMCIAVQGHSYTVTRYSYIEGSTAAEYMKKLIDESSR